MSQTHYLKTWPTYYDAVARGEKTFEVRKDDRGFQRGDTVVLRRFEPSGDVRHQNSFPESLPCMEFTIGWILTGGQFGIEPGFVVFSLERKP